MAVFAAARSYNGEKASFSTFVKLCINRAIGDYAKAFSVKKRIPSKLITSIDNIEVEGSESPEKLVIDKESYDLLSVKLKVILSAEDMIEYNFTFDNFLCDDREINTMFRRIASIAAKEAGIVIDNCKFFIEALKKDASTVILIITKEPVCSNIQKRYKGKY